MAIVTSEKIFVDVDDEINFVVEKIFSAEKDRVILVVPQNALIISSQVSIKILAKQMLNTKKLLVLVSEDAFGLKLAKQAGIVTSGKVSNVTAEVWESAQIAQAKAKNLAMSTKKELLTRRGLLEPTEVEKDELAAEISEEFEQMDDLLDEEDKSSEQDSKINQTSEKNKSNKKGSDELDVEESKLAAGKAKKTSNQTFDSESEDDDYETEALEEDLSENEDEDAIDFKEEQVRGAIQRVRPQPKLVKLGNLEVFAAGDVSVVESQASDNMEDEIPNRFGNAFTTKPKGGFTGKDLTRYAPRTESRGFWAKLFNRQPKRVSLEDIENGKNPNNKRRKYIIGGIVAAVLLLGSYAVYAMVYQLNSIDLLVTLKTTEVPVSQTLTIDTAKTEIDTLNLVLPAILIEEEDLSASNQATPTGQGKTGVKASGNIEIWNFSTENDYNLPAGTRVVNKATGRAYLTRAAVTIPKGSTQNNVVNPGGVSSSEQQFSIAIEAEQVGAEYNIEISGTSDIPEFSVSNYADTVLVGKGVKGAIAGGTTENFATPSQEDIDKLKKTLVEDLTRQGSIRLQAKVEEGYRLIAGTEFFTEEEVRSTPAIGERAEGDFTLSVSGKINALAVKEEDLQAAIAQLVLANQDNPDGFEVRGLENAVFAEVTRSNNTARFKVTSAGSLRSKIDEQSIKSSIAGKSVSDARAFLSSQEDIATYTLRFNLGFLPEGIQLVPSDWARISVRITN